MHRMKPNDLKLEGSKAYKRKDYATAVKLYSMVLLCHLSTFNLLF